MGSKAIKIENLSKAYQVGDFSSGTISRDLERYWALLRGKEDPFLKIGETNDRSQTGNSDIVWSLKDINLEIEQGDAVGIIGRNGAGKSTLLKILSRVTSPTTGSIKVRGRIASLLEVGTGFHPELTGRENIFLNGAILGMRKTEIKRKFDEIVSFAGIERYIDTPVKRYSSGMYVRLAFAVAAHLESEILIVDEVLAVGDAEFQKKCLGKMNDVSRGDGRTVLFVSHNMAAVTSLCNKGVVLNQGTKTYYGSTQNAIKKFEESSAGQSLSGVWVNLIDQMHKAHLNKISLHDVQNIIRTSFISNEEIVLSFEACFFTNIEYVKIGFDLLKDGITVFRSQQVDKPDLRNSFKTDENVVYTCTIPANLLNHGLYYVKPQFSVHGVETLTKVKEAVISFTIDLYKDNYFKTILDPTNFPGSVYPQLKWAEKN